MSENIEKSVRQALCENSEIKTRALEVGLNENLLELGINSFTFIKITVALEMEFEIEFDEENLNPKRFETIQGIIDYVEEKIRDKS